MKPTTEPGPQLPEHCPQAEWMLIACLIEKPEILPNVSLDHFYLTECRSVFERIVTLSARPDGVNYVSVPMSFRKETALFTALVKSMGDLPSPHNWPYWLEVLDEYRVARQTGKLAAEIALAASNLSPADGIDLQSYVDRLTSLKTNKAKPDDIRGVVDRAMADIEAEFNDPKSVFGLSTGFSTWDRYCRGLHAGDMVVVAARPGVGKTAFALNVAYEIGVRQNQPTTIFSLEMASDKLIRRILHAESGVEPEKVRRQRLTEFDISQFAMVQNAIRKAPICIYDRLTDIHEILAAVDADQVEHRPKLIVVDYIQRISTERISGGRQFEVAAISSALKSLAMRHKAAVLVLSQISRAVEKDNRQPQLSDIRDSGQIEQDADQVAFLHPSAPRDPEKAQALVNLLLQKNRSGPIGSVNLVFRYDHTKFYEEGYDDKQ